METPRHPQDVEALLAQRDFVRGLARRLLADEHRAEDLAQGALAAVLARPPLERPSGEGGLRAYLGGVLRNLAREERRSALRRTERERLAARPEPTTSTDAFVAREEWRRRVVEAVLELEPHAREVVLLRFFEGLPPRRIAQRLGLPVETVKTRLKRALASLRPRLAAGRGRGELLEGLALLALPHRALSFLAPGAALMSHLSKLALAAAVLLCAGIAYRAAREPAPLSPGARDVAAPVAGVPQSTPASAGRDAEARAAIAGPPAVEAAPAARDSVAHRFRGRAVDGRRFPVRDAHVELRVAGQEPRVARSGPDGSFEIEASVPAEVRNLHLLAHDGAGAAGRSQIAAPKASDVARPVELEPLVLLPAHTLAVRVLADGLPAAHARVRAELGHSRVLEFEEQADARGELLLEHLPRGIVHLSTRDPERGARASAFVPEDAAAVLELVPLGVVEVLVRDLESGSPVAGADVRVSESVPILAPLPGETLLHGNHGEGGLVRLVESSPTDAEGRARVGGLYPGTSYRLAVQSPGYRDLGGAYSPRVEVGGSAVVVELEPQRARTVDRPVVAGEPRRIDVIVRDPAGLPVTGAGVAAREGSRRLGSPAATDGEGRARLEGLHGALASVYVTRPGSRIDGADLAVGIVDLRLGDGELAVTLAPPRELLLQIRIDGEPRLPAVYELAELHGRLDRKSQPLHLVREDPAAGELLLDVEDPGPRIPLRLSLAAPGFRRADLAVELPPDGSRAVAEVALERSLLLVVRTRRLAHGSSHVFAERFDEATGTWRTADVSRHHGGLRRPNGPDESFVFECFGPGRWRALDRASGKASDEVEVQAGVAVAEVELDLGSIQVVSGRVELEDPGELRLVRVLVVGSGSEDPRSRWEPGGEPPEGVHVDPADGSFRTLVPGDRLVRIVPWHPWLVPAGTPELRSARDGVVLRLVAGDELRLPLPAGAEERRLGSFRPAQALRIARFDDAIPEELPAEPLEWHHAPIADGTARCALPRGRWTLWIDPGPGYAPAVLRGVEIGGVTELASSPFEDGSALRVRLAVPAGQAAPRILVSAHARGALPYYRDLNSRGEEEVVLGGLGPGRFAVHVSRFGFLGALRELEVELDGRTDRVLEIELR